MKKRMGAARLLLLAAVFALLSGCSTGLEKSDGGGNAHQDGGASYSLSYGWCITGDVYVSEETRQLLNKLGQTQYIVPATPVTEVYTEIPEFENNASGTDPVHILLPDLELSKYNVCAWRDTETGVTTSGWYRMVGGMMTDELVKYEVGPSGNVTQYETVNLGKYDGLGVDESKFENWQSTFSSAITKALGVTEDWQYYVTTPTQTVFRVFTDSQERIVIITTVTIEQDNNLIKADLYAVIS